MVVHTDYSDTIEAINAMASVKMAMNRHKGNIEDCPRDMLIKLMRAEVDELEEAEDLMHIIEEAADIQNFLVAVVHQQIQKYRGRK